MIYIYPLIFFFLIRLYYRNANFMWIINQLKNSDLWGKKPRRLSIFKLSLPCCRMTPPTTLWPIFTLGCWAVEKLAFRSTKMYTIDFLDMICQAVIKLLLIIRRKERKKSMNFKLKIKNVFLYLYIQLCFLWSLI